MTPTYKHPLYKRPRGGWKYTCHDFTFEADSHEGLVSALTEYRNNHRLPLGNPDKEIREHICTENPWLANWSTELPDSTTITDNDIEAKLDDWLNKMHWEDRERAVPPIYKDRCKTCENCGYNHSADKFGFTYQRKVFMLSRGILADNLGYCECYMHDNRVACHIDKYTPKPIGKPPPDCWVGK